MSEMNSYGPGLGGGDDDRFGGFAYAPEGVSEVHEQDPVVRGVELRANKYAGPFRHEQGQLSDDFDDLHRWLGISRELFDDVMAWNDEFAALEGHSTDDWKRQHFATQQGLLRRLAREVHPGIEVDTSRDEPPTLVQLSRLNVDADSAHLVLWDAEAVETGRVKVLPYIPEPLTRRILTWIAETAKHDGATPHDSAAIFGWEDEGSAIARDLQQLLGDDYYVSAP